MSQKRSALLVLCLALCVIASGCRAVSTPVLPTMTPGGGVPGETPTPTSWPDTPTPVPTTPPTLTPTHVINTVPQAATVTLIPSTPAAPSASTPVPPAPTPAAPATATRPPQGDDLGLWQDTITLQSYGWQEALVETSPGDVIYPHPRLDASRVSPPAPRTYQTVILENAYIRLTILPELGGRILRWLDKSTGQEMFYVNPVLKPTQWGARGWWLASGGMEWAFPVEEHGLVEYRPWDVELIRAEREVAALLSTTDERTGMTASVRVSLYTQRKDVILLMDVRNPTDHSQEVMFWSNGMFALSPNNRPGENVQLALPGERVLVHSTGDGTLPAGGKWMDWPLYNGRDMSRYGTWTSWLGIFGETSEFVGAYNPDSGLGVVRVCERSAAAKGVKIFGPGTLDPGLWTDDGSGYVELWGGLTRRFDQSMALGPHGRVGWQERWYAVNGLGGLTAASSRAAVWLDPAAGRVGVTAPGHFDGDLILWHNGQPWEYWSLAMATGEVFQDAFTPESGTWGIELRVIRGRVLAYGDVGTE